MRTMVFALLFAAVAACSSDSAGDRPVARSTAVVRVGDVEYSFAATCYDAGTGSVVAVGTGTEPVTLRPTRVLLQAFITEPYVGVTVGDAETEGDSGTDRFEATVDEALQLVFEDDVIAATDVRFVRDLDLGTGAGEPVGTGTVHARCVEYAAGLPPGYTR